MRWRRGAHCESRSLRWTKRGPTERGVAAAAAAAEEEEREEEVVVAQTAVARRAPQD